MREPLFIVAFLFQIFYTSAAIFNALKQGQSLFVEKSNDVLASKNGVFVAGFSLLMITLSALQYGSTTLKARVVWMANRDQPVNRKWSKFSLLNTGSLILLDAGQIIVWSWTTDAASAVLQLQLLNNGNFVLHSSDNVIFWQSFGWPTDTLLPGQLLTRNISFVLSKGQTDWSSGLYKLYFENSNVLRLLFRTPDVSSRYWPIAGLTNLQAARPEYNNSRVAVFDSSGYFISSDDLSFSSIDFRANLFRRLTLDPDGILRLYSLQHTGDSADSWQAISNPCRIHGICRPNSVCTDHYAFGRSCSCLPGYHVNHLSDWSSGCESDFYLSCENDYQFNFVNFNHVEFYGYDRGYYTNYTLESCEKECLKLCDCKGFYYKINKAGGYYKCYPKTLLLNGYLSPNLIGEVYLKLPKGGGPFAIEIPSKT